MLFSRKADVIAFKTILRPSLWKPFFVFNLLPYASCLESSCTYVVKSRNIKLLTGWQPFSIFIFSDKKRSPFLGGVRDRVWSIMAGANNLVVPVGTYRILVNVVRYSKRS